MDMHSTSPLPEPDPSLVPSAPSASGLSILQREWAREFILSSGNATKAAILAGYAEASARISGRKNCLNPQVMAYVKQLSTADAQQFLPIAVRTFVEVACDPEQDGRARVMAAEKLVMMAGAMPKSGGVQVNVGVQINGQQVQGLIASVWKARSARMSDIPATMPDGSQQIEADPVEPAALPAPAPGRGGAQFSGSHLGSSSIPPPSPTPNPFLDEGPDDGWPGPGAQDLAEEMFDGGERGILAPDEAAGGDGWLADGSAADAWREALSGRSGARADRGDDD